MSLIDVRKMFINITGRKDLAKNELVFNGTFNVTAHGWVVDGSSANYAGGWYHSGGKMNHTTGFTNALHQYAPYINIRPGAEYRVRFTLSNRTAGSVTICLGDTNSSDGYSASVNTDYDLNLYGRDEKWLEIVPTSDFDGSIDSISIIDYDSQDSLDYISPADMYINNGQQWLDDQLDHRKTIKRYQVDISAGDSVITFYACRWIKEVWVMNADGRREVSKDSLNALRNYYNEAPADLEQGTPASYSPAVIGLTSEQKHLTSATGAHPYTAQFTYDSDDLTLATAASPGGAHYALTGIVFNPPADEAYTMAVWGKFDSQPLYADGDRSFWTDRYPNYLVHAAAYQLAIAMANREKVDYWYQVIQQELLGLQKDMAEENFAKINNIPR
jgi:hypothetical protein